MDLFYRGYDPSARITSGAKHLSAAAARFAVSMVMSIPQLPQSAWEEFKQRLSINALWGLCLVIAGWLIVSVVGGLIGVAVNALLIAYGLSELWDEVTATSAELKEWAVQAYQAQRDEELAVAASHFAAALSKGGLLLIEVIVTHRVFRVVEVKLRNRFPTPDWLHKKYAEAVKQREELGRQRERASAIEKAKQLAEKVTETVAGGVRYEGAKRLAGDFPTTAVVVTGAALAVGSLAVAAWASRTDSRRGGS